MSNQLTVWSESMDEDGKPAGMLHWGEVGKGPLCDKSGGMFVTDLDMNAALAAGRKAGYGVYPCATCGRLYTDT